MSDQINIKECYTKLKLAYMKLKEELALTQAENQDYRRKLALLADGLEALSAEVQFLKEDD